MLALEAGKRVLSVAYGVTERTAEVNLVVGSGTRIGSKVNAVTTPRLPAPAPRSAQDRSGWC